MPKYPPRHSVSNKKPFIQILPLR